MLAAATWIWAVVGVLAFLALGVLAAVALGLVELPGDLFRRAGQAAAGGRVEGGQPVPDEVPDRTPAEAAEEAEQLREH